MFKSMLIPLVSSYVPNALRHASQAAAGALMAYGYADGSEAAAVGGAVLTLLTFAWSTIEKRGLLNKVFS